MYLVPNQFLHHITHFHISKVAVLSHPNAFAANASGISQPTKETIKDNQSSPAIPWPAQLSQL
jgi:hypothetical protein